MRGDPAINGELLLSTLCTVPTASWPNISTVCPTCKGDSRDLSWGFRLVNALSLHERDPIPGQQIVL